MLFTRVAAAMLDAATYSALVLLGATACAVESLLAAAMQVRCDRFH